mmetsp:Transcript_113/g.239  ORF Transcript_113/g.239 Transcript_113/m.239 type:complete len:267 (-) Transcript_113:789-1589(-)
MQQARCTRAMALRNNLQTCQLCTQAPAVHNQHTKNETRSTIHWPSQPWRSAPCNHAPSPPHCLHPCHPVPTSDACSCACCLQHRDQGTPKVSAPAGGLRAARANARVGQHEGAHRQLLGALNELLVHALRLRAHDHRPRLGVDLGVEARVEDEVGDPLLRRLNVHVEPPRQQLDVNGLVYPAVGLEDEQARVLHKLLLARGEEKVVVDHVLALLELLLRAVKVVVHKQRLQELGHGVAVLVRLLLDGPDQVLEHCAPALVDHDSCC